MTITAITKFTLALCLLPVVVMALAMWVALCMVLAGVRLAVGWVRQILKGKQ